MRNTRRYRTIWISDVHLGTRGCQAEPLLDFLTSTRCDTLYLAGDIVDGWRMRRSVYWTDEQNELVRTVLRMAHHGTRVVYLPGNHDEVFHGYAGMSFGGIEIANEAIHETADGRRLLVLHGDAFDGVVRYAKWLALVGDRAYEAALVLNRWFNAVRRRLGFPYWSLSAVLKHKVKNAVEFVSNFETAVAAAARARRVDGVVCGHIHCPQMRYIDGVLYCNDGDWVESCTALVEDDRGQLSVLHWAAGAAELRVHEDLVPVPHAA